MADLLQQYVEAYQETERDAWERIHHEHNKAMVARDLEDLIELGIFVLKKWNRAICEWHDDVSQNAEEYDQSMHSRLKTIESGLVDTTQKTLEMVRVVTSWGYELAREGEFAGLAQQVILAGRSADEQFSDESFVQFRKNALKEYERGDATEIEHWGQ